MSIVENAVWQNPEFVEKYLTRVRAGIPLAREQFELMLRLIAGTGCPVRSFLDLGCGDGILGAIILEEHCKAGGVFLDYSAEMLSAAKERLAGYGNRVRLILEDFSRPDWVQRFTNEAPFDAVVSGYAIHHQPDERKRDIYREIYGLLDIGGIFINIEHVASPTLWAAEIHDQLFIDSICRSVQARGGPARREEIGAKYRNRLDEAENILAPVDLQLSWLRRIGYRDVDCYFKIGQLAVFAGRK